jgi:hypothetical protein
MIDELSFASAEAAMRYCEKAGGRIGSLPSRIVSDRLSVLTEEHILYDVSGGGS